MESYSLSRSCVPFSLTEREALRFFVSREMISLDILIKFAEMMGSTVLKLKENLQESKEKNICLDHVYDVFVTETLNNFTVHDIIKLLFLQGCGTLAKKLFWCFNDIKPGKRTLSVPKVVVRNRDNVTSYFIKIKNLVHARAFSNPYEHVKKIGNDVKLQLNSTQNEKDRRFLCDKYVALKAIEYDAGSNVSKLATENDETFEEMEHVLDQTSIPTISRVLLYGRKADALSTLRRFKEGENMLTEAYVCADVTYACLEIVDMVYKGIVFKLSHFEHTQTPDLQKEILFDAHRALTLLSQENEDDQKFWKILLILRMVFALLGIGKQCRIIRNYHPTQSQLNEAKTLLSSIQFRNIDHRKQMFYFTAVARLHEHKEQTTWCIYYLQRAMILAIMGNYSEKKFINEYGEIMGKDLTYLFDCVVKDNPPIRFNPPNSTENQLDLLDSLPDFTENIPIDEYSLGHGENLRDSADSEMEIAVSPTLLASTPDHSITMSDSLDSTNSSEGLSGFSSLSSLSSSSSSDGINDSVTVED